MAVNHVLLPTRPAASAASAAAAVAAAVAAAAVDATRSGDPLCTPTI